MMTTSNFKLKCPHCEHPHEFVDDNWRDELIDDSGPSYIDCEGCGKEMMVTTHTVYTLEAELPD